jgi:hypothetical protein
LAPGADRRGWAAGVAIRPRCAPQLRDVTSTKFRVLERHAPYITDPELRFYPQQQCRVSEQVTWLNFPTGEQGDRRFARFANLEDAQAFLDEVVEVSLRAKPAANAHPYTPRALRPESALGVPAEPTYTRSDVAEILNRLHYRFTQEGLGPMVDYWTEGNCRAFQEAAQRCKAEAEKLYYVPPPESEDE